jgi:hypothetical protein
MSIAKFTYRVRLTTHLNKFFKFIEAIPRLTMLVQFLAVLSIASAIGSLHHYYKQTNKV